LRERGQALLFSNLVRWPVCHVCFWESIIFLSSLLLLVVFSCFVCKLVSPASCRHCKQICFLIITVILCKKKGGAGDATEKIGRNHLGVVEKRYLRIVKEAKKKYL
jgi:hypothetical protein